MKVLLCCDLDRTILPNGPGEESPRARPMFGAVAAREELTLAYVSGRNETLLKEAVADYGVPEPDYAIGDVGTTIYHVSGGAWEPWEAWWENIRSDWSGKSGGELVHYFDGVEGLRLQEPDKQNRFKLSFYADPDMDTNRTLRDINGAMEMDGIRTSLIWSVDEVKGVGLLDAIPERATKAHAVKFLMEKTGFDRSNTVFAGDSGNDLPALTSGINAVLVKNAMDEVKEAALRKVDDKKINERLYVAQGGFLGMNGNYAAGVLEGLAHFIPETKEWMENGRP